MPALQVLDSVQNGTVEMGHTANYYYIGKDPTWALFCATPFGLNARQQNAWFYDGEGTKLIDDFGKKFNVHCLSAGNTGCQMGGWFNKELKEPADLAGLKMRIGGWAGQTLQSRSTPRLRRPTATTRKFGTRYRRSATTNISGGRLPNTPTTPS